MQQHSWLETMCFWQVPMLSTILFWRIVILSSSTYQTINSRSISDDKHTIKVQKLLSVTDMLRQIHLTQKTDQNAKNMITLWSFLIMKLQMHSLAN